MPFPEPVRRLPLDDLSHPAEVIGGARATGENNHHIRECGLLREHLAAHAPGHCLPTTSPSSFAVAEGGVAGAQR